MNYKLCLYLFFLLICKTSFAQNNHILYDFNELPQTLMLNPGAEVNYDMHIGIPFMSNVFFQGGATNKSVTFNSATDGVSGNLSERFSSLLYSLEELGLDNDDYFQGSQRLEVFNVGFRLKDPKNYLTIGFYQEIDGFSTHPEEFVSFYLHGDPKDNDGNTIANEKNFNNLNFQADFIGVLHIGLSKQINEKLTVGGRLKFISASLGIQAIESSGKYEFDGGNTHSFDDMDVSINNSGFIDEDGDDVFISVRDNVSGLFFGKGNFGIGIDLGMTYHFNDKLTLTASLLDLDYVSYTEENTTFELNGIFPITETAFSPPKGDEMDYWIDKFNTTTNFETSSSNFNITRSPKIHASLSYNLKNRMVKKQKGSSAFRNVYCEVNNQEEESKTEFGLHTYTVFRPSKLIWAVSPFISHDFNKYFTAKLTYSYNQFSSKNIGVGISTHFKMFNLYATADNLLDLPKLKDTNYASLQFGMNLIFN